MTFSLRHLLLLTTALCGYVGVVWAFPVGVSLILLGLVTAWIPAICLGGILYSRENSRAFWCGAAICGTVPALLATWWIMLVILDNPEVLLVGLTSLSDDFEREACYPFALLHTFSFLAGMIVVWMRKIYKPSRGLRT